MTEISDFSFLLIYEIISHQSHPPWIFIKLMFDLRRPDADHSGIAKP